MPDDPRNKPVAEHSAPAVAAELPAPLSLVQDAIQTFRKSLDITMKAALSWKFDEAVVSNLTGALGDIDAMVAGLDDDPARVLKTALDLSSLMDRLQADQYLNDLLGDIYSDANSPEFGIRSLSFQLARSTTVARKLVEDAMARLSPEATEAPTSQLSNILPAQKPAPLRFKIEADVLRVDHIPAEAEEDVARATAATRAQLAENGRALIEALKAAGNVDRRVLQTVEQLQTLLASQQDVVQLAIANIGAEFVFAAAEEEMSATLFGALRGFSQGIAMYAAQFPDWQKFAENAAAVDLTEQDVAAVVADARALVAKLESAAPNVDPEVPKTIAFLLDLIGKPAHTSKRAFFAVVRTLENLAASIFQRAANIWGATLDGAAEGMKGGTKKVVTVTLIAVAIQAATGLGPVAAKLPDAKWVTQALEIVKKQLETAPKG